MSNNLNYINELFHLSDLQEIFLSFLLNSNYQSFKYVLTGVNYPTKLPDWSCNKKYDKFDVLNLFSGDNLFVFDLKTVYEMLVGTSCNKIDVCLALDNQAVSYLKGIFTAKPSNIPLDKQQYIELLLREDVTYDYTPYVWENMKKISDEKISFNVLETIKACERFKSMDVEIYKKNGEIRYTKNEDEIEQLSIGMYQLMEQGNQNERMSSFWKRQEASYLLLLKAVIINFSSNRNARHKFEELFNFVNDDLGVVLEREMVICYHFFNRDHLVDKFFKRIQTTNKDLIKDIYGMSWDLFHIRHMEFMMGKQLLEEARYTVFSLLTFDRGMAECIEVCPIRKYIISEEKLYPLFEYGIRNILSEKDFDNMYMYNIKNGKI